MLYGHFYETHLNKVWKYCQNENLELFQSSLHMLIDLMEPTVSTVKLSRNLYLWHFNVSRHWATIFYPQTKETITVHLSSYWRTLREKKMG